VLGNLARSRRINLSFPYIIAIVCRDSDKVRDPDIVTGMAG
jgi:hypothetical protein